MFNSITFYIFEISRATVVIVSIRDTNDLIWQIGITKQNCNYPTVIPTKPFASHVFSYHPYLKLDINASISTNKEARIVGNDIFVLFHK